MRIRKHLRLTTQLSAAGDGREHSPLQSPVCLLSHLPSVVFDPPSSLPKVTKVEDFAATGDSFGNSSTGADDSASTLKIAGDGEVKSINLDEEEEERVVLCGMKNATTGWKCKKQAARGKVHCEHHLQQLRNYSITRNKKNKMKKKIKETNREEDQAMSGSGRKRKATFDSNYPYDYYYYSGFGPSWGKKRGNTVTNTNNNKKYESVAQEEDEGFIFSSSSSSSEKCEIDEIDSSKDSDNEEEEECGEIGKKVVCKRTSGTGWKCQAVAARGEVLCKHHLEQQRKYIIKQKRKFLSKRKKMKKDMADPAAIVDGGIRVAKTTFSSNQHDCSGYGTSDWGKNRGVDTKRDEVFADYQALRISPLPSEISGIDRIRIDYAEDNDSDDDVIG